jgi:ribosome-associated protein
MRKVANFCDFFVLSTGTSSRQVQAIAKGIEDGLQQEFDAEVRRKQGIKEGRWVILDLGNVVAHIFDADTRDFYGIEFLWQEASPVPWP